MIFLLPHVRQQRHKPRALDGFGQLPLMLRADVRMAWVDDLCLARNEPTQKLGLFIVDIF
jgi:hypothetical protein